MSNVLGSPAEMMARFSHRMVPSDAYLTAVNHGIVHDLTATFGELLIPGIATQASPKEDNPVARTDMGPALLLPEGHDLTIQGQVPNAMTVDFEYTERPGKTPERTRTLMRFLQVDDETAVRIQAEPFDARAGDTTYVIGQRVETYFAWSDATNDDVATQENGSRSDPAFTPWGKYIDALRAERHLRHTVRPAAKLAILAVQDQELNPNPASASRRNWLAA